MRILLLLSLLAATSSAAEAPKPAVTERAYLLQAARLFDARAGRIVTPGRVVVVGGRIVAVGPTAKAPEGATVIELGDATLLPGFIDAHTHLASQPGEDWRRDLVDSLQRTIPEKTLRTVPWARATLDAGFTTVRNLGAIDSVDVGLREAIAAGAIAGPRILTATASVGTTGGHCDRGNSFRKGSLAKETGEGVANGPDALRAKVRELIKYGADVIKVCATGGVLSLSGSVDAPQLTQAELDAVVDEAHTQGRKVAAHAHGGEGARRAVRAGVDSIEHGSFLDEATLALMRKQRTWFVPTMMALKGVEERLQAGTLAPAQAQKARKAIRSHGEVVRRAVKKGVRIAFGTDAGVFKHGRNAEEFALLVEAGLTPVQALQAATVHSAELLGVGDRLGALEPGKVADVIAVPGDPLRDIRATQRVFFVMKEGALHRHQAGP